MYTHPGQANGQGPSIAQAQLQQATDANLKQAMALGATQQGMGAGGALRGIQQQQAGIAQQQAADSGMLRLQEQAQAQGLLGNVLGAGRGQDIGLAGEQAGLSQQAGLANMGAQNQFGLAQAQGNLNAQLQQQQMNDQLVQFYLQAGLSLDQAQMQAKLQMEKMKADQATQQAAIQQQAYEGSRKGNTNLLGAAGGVLGLVGL